MMKKSQLLFVASLTALLSLTACKSTNAAIEKSQSETIATQQDVKTDYHTLDNGQLAGQWLIDKAMEQPVTGNEVANIIFDTHGNRIYGNNGCNSFSGKLVLGENCSISFVDCVTTLMACHPEVTDKNVMQALGATTHYDCIKNDKNKMTINLLDKAGTVVATLSKQMQQQLNGYWEIIEIEGKKVKLDAMPTIVLDIETGKLTGNSGCNIMNGHIEYDATTANNKIKFIGIASTRRMCAPDAMAIEDKVLDILNKINSFEIINDKQIKLYSATDANANIVLQKNTP